MAIKRVILFTRLPVTRWVKLNLNYELLVNRVMKFLLCQRLFDNNIFVQLELFRIQETTMLQNKIKDKFNGIQVTNFHKSTEP